MTKTREASDRANSDARSFERDYTIHLRVRADSVIPVGRVDDIVSAVVDNSTAREAIADGLYYGNTTYTVGKGLDEEFAAIEVLNFYLSDAGRIPGDLRWGEPGDCRENEDDEESRHYGMPHCIWCLEAM